MSFFHRDPPKNNDEYIEREREYDRLKRERLLKELQEQTKDNKAGLQSETKAADPVIEEQKTFTGSAQKKGIRQRFSEYRLKREIAREGKTLKAYKKKLDKDEAKTKGVLQKEEAIFGRTLTDEERGRYSQYKEDKALKKEIRKHKIKKELVSTGKAISAIGARSSGMPNPLSGPSILDINASNLEQRKESFDSDFGRMMMGRKPLKGKKKKGGIKPLSFNVFD